MKNKKLYVFFLHIPNLRLKLDRYLWDVDQGKNLRFEVLHA